MNSLSNYKIIASKPLKMGTLFLMITSLAVADTTINGGSLVASIPLGAGVVNLLAKGGIPSLGTISANDKTSVISLSGLTNSGTISVGSGPGTAILSVNGGDYGGVLMR